MEPIAKFTHSPLIVTMCLLRDSIGPTNIEKGLLWFEGVRYGDIQIHVKKFCMVWCSAVYPELPQLTHSLMQYLVHSIMWIYFLGVRN